MGFFREWREYRRFLRLPPSERRIVFYAESKGDWPHIGPLAEEVARSGRNVAYLTSDSSDPLLGPSRDPGIAAFFVGSGSVRTWLFKSMPKCVMVMTLPDLETFHLKRSVQPVHYVYVFHSLVSTHMIYRKGAFDAYDTILCGGPHHVEEILRTEREYGLKPKALLEFGYPRLDALRKSAGSGARSGAEAPRILLAPSWGPSCLVETCAPEVIEGLLEAGYRVTLRPHPMTGRRNPEKIQAVLDRFGSHERFKLDVEVRTEHSLHEADLMVSDWSGAALEFGLGLGKPVVFLDTPRKVNNPEYERIGKEPLEVSIRAEIGKVLDVGRIGELPLVVRECLGGSSGFAERARSARERTVFNVGSSAEVGARQLLEISEKAAGTS